MTSQPYDFMCVLSYNYIYEKLCLVSIVAISFLARKNILQVLWFYYAVAFLATAGAILFRCAICASPALRCRIILTRRTAETRKIYRGIRNGTVSCPTSAPPDLILQYVDWFWLRQIRRNADDVFFEELLDSLYKDHGEGLWSRRPGRGGLGNDEESV